MNKITKKNSMLFLCDIQEVFRKLIFNNNTLINNSIYLTKSANLLKIPILVTEHNKKTFGPLLPEINNHLIEENTTYFEKLKFSMLTEEVEKHLKQQKEINNIILFGIETHVCILQTALDLKRKGYEIYLVTDAVSSQRAYDRKIALKRMENNNINLTTTESIIFELLEKSDSPEFKNMLKIIKEHKPNNLNYN